MKRFLTIVLCMTVVMSVSLSAKAQDVTITLYPGWNWISYPKAEVLDINTALGDFVPVDGDMIKSQFSNSVFSNGYWRGGVTHFMPGWGYHYYSNRTEIVSFVFGPPAPQLIVTTAEPTNITAISAVSGGSLSSFDGSYIFVLEKGICWATHPNPTVMNDFHTENGSGINGFTAEMTDLNINTMYYVRAYAVTERGTIYGEEMIFTTRDGIPVVSTDSVTNILGNVANCYYTVTDNGGLEVVARGVCWSTGHNPSLNDNYITDGSGLGTFSINMNELSLNTTYYVRAFATTTHTTAYGDEISFTTLELPIGAINGLFSVSSTRQVLFSQGNLQYQASTDTWKFAEQQWNKIGEDNNNISPTYEGWIDLFGWGTSGYNHGAMCYLPYSNLQTNNYYYAYGSSTYNLNDSTGMADWGYNPISNGGNQSNQWRTLTSVEWEFVFNLRTTATGIRYARANVNNVNGVILLPDDWDSTYYALNNTNQSNANYTCNEITISQWSTMEEHGAVFIPGAGCRIGIQYYWGNGDYWSASFYNNNYAYLMCFTNSELTTQGYNSRFVGRSVRLVQDYYQ